MAYERALALAREVAGPAELATALTNLATLRGVTDDTEQAFALLAEAEDVALQTSDPILLGKVRWSRGSVYFLHEDPSLDQPEEALAEFIAAGELFEGSDFTFDIGWTRRMIGIVRISLGMIDEGEAEIRSALDHFISVGDLSALPLLISDFARIAVASGNWEEASAAQRGDRQAAIGERNQVGRLGGQSGRRDRRGSPPAGSRAGGSLVAEGHQLTVEEVLSRVSSSNFRGTWPG